MNKIKCTMLISIFLIKASFAGILTVVNNSKHYYLAYQTDNNYLTEAQTNLMFVVAPGNTYQIFYGMQDLPDGSDFGASQYTFYDITYSSWTPQFVSNYAAEYYTGINPSHYQSNFCITSDSSAVHGLVDCIFPQDSYPFKIGTLVTAPNGDSMVNNFSQQNGNLATTTISSPQQ